MNLLFDNEIQCKELNVDWIDWIDDLMDDEIDDRSGWEVFFSQEYGDIEY